MSSLFSLFGGLFLFEVVTNFFALTLTLVALENDPRTLSKAALVPD